MKQMVERFFPYAAILLVFLLLLSRLLFGLKTAKRAGRPRVAVRFIKAIQIV